MIFSSSDRTCPPRFIDQGWRKSGAFNLSTPGGTAAFFHVALNWSRNVSATDGLRMITSRGDGSQKKNEVLSR